MRIRSPLAIAIVVLAAACGGASGTEPTASDPTVPPTVPEPAVTSVPGTVPTNPGTTPAGQLRYDPATVRTELDAARGRWTDSGSETYRYSYTPVCFCPQQEIEVQVIAGRIVDRTDQARSIGDWFDEIDAAIGIAADIQVNYDDRGHPTSLFIDVDEIMADEEFGFQLVDLVRVPDAVSEFMPDAYGCGFGFAVASPDETAALVVRLQGLAEGENGPGTTRYELADTSAEIRIGTDLMANWCDDVFEEGEPEADVTERWPVVGGTLDVTVGADGTATGMLVDIVAESPDGQEQRLGNAFITNDAWGFFAG